MHYLLSVASLCATFSLFAAKPLMICSVSVKARVLASRNSDYTVPDLPIRKLRCALAINDTAAGT
jgi:hypothetical protein